MNDYYVYAHKKKNDGSIFYIGKGRGERCFIKHGRNKHWNNIVNKYGYSIEILKSCINEYDALILETEFISRMKKQGVKLCNQTNGGDGLKGVSISEIMRNKFRMAKLGKKQKPEHAKKSAMARIGKKNSAWHRERTVEGKRKKIISSDGICFISSCHAARYLTEMLNKKCYQGLISMCARGLRNNAYGITWSYDTSTIPKFLTTKTPAKFILNITNNMQFESVNKAKEWVSKVKGTAQHQSISYAARSNGEHPAYGYYWKYL